MNNSQFTQRTIRQAAINRVYSSPVLELAADLFLDSEWDNQDEHDKWVATAPEAELIDWAKTIRSQGEL